MQTLDSGVPVFIGGLLADNLRANLFGCSNLSRVLKTGMPSVAVNEPGARDEILSHARSLLPKVREAGFGRYLEGVSL